MEKQHLKMGGRGAIQKKRGCAYHRHLVTNHRHLVTNHRHLVTNHRHLVTGRLLEALKNKGLQPIKKNGRIRRFLKNLYCAACPA